MPGATPLQEVVMQNVGTLDRVIRVIVGVALFALVFVGPQTPWGWVGLAVLLTGVVGWCPLYALLRISTNGRVGPRTS
jgi:hypothetical protein